MGRGECWVRGWVKVAWILAILICAFNGVNCTLLGRNVWRVFGWDLDFFLLFLLLLLVLPLFKSSVVNLHGLVYLEGVMVVLVMLVLALKASSEGKKRLRWRELLVHFSQPLSTNIWSRDCMVGRVRSIFVCIVLFLVGIEDNVVAALIENGAVEPEETFMRKTLAICSC